MKILSVSDHVVDWIYSPKIRSMLADVDIVIGCGDLPAYFLEYIASTLDVPVIFVHGNHILGDFEQQQKTGDTHGLIDLHRKFLRYDSHTFAGVEGCLRYKEGPYQYSQLDMWLHVIHLVPPMVLNHIRYGRYLDVFISHAPPSGIHDQPDLPHQGIDAFRWLLNQFKPMLHLHGHIHVYRPDTVTETLYRSTRVINSFGYRLVAL